MVNFTISTSLRSLCSIVRLVELDKKACNQENSGGKLTPFGQGGGSVLFEFVATVEMALEVEMVVDRGMNGDEFL